MTPENYKYMCHQPANQKLQFELLYDAGIWVTVRATAKQEVSIYKFYCSINFSIQNIQN